MAELRVIDAGTVTAQRSQYLWHGIASAMTAESRPVLSLCRPAEPYVCLGYHRPLAEVDRETCRQRGWPVLRRQIGGGPVYIDSDQLFFQLTLPAAKAPARIDRLYERLLAPAVSAFQILGLTARLDGANDIAVEGRKVSGTGAGRIGEAVTVVGNVIFRFPHRRMVDALSLPTETARRDCLALMRRHVSSLELEGRESVTVAEAGAALRGAYAEDLDREAVASHLTDREETAIERWERRAGEESWLAGPDPIRSSKRWVKIREGVWLYFCHDRDVTVELSVVRGLLESVAIRCAAWNGEGSEMSRALSGQAADASVVARCLEPFDETGARVAAILRPGLELG